MQTTHINNLDFARANTQITSDTLDFAGMPRLQAALSDGNKTGQAIFSLQGYVNKYPIPSIVVDIQADITVDCQRCMSPINLPITLEFEYLITDTEPEQEELSGMDWLEVETKMDIAQLIEDELLLAIPFAPVHEYDCGDVASHQEKKESPFAVLKGKFK